MCKSSIFKIFFPVYTTLHCQSTDRIRLKFYGSGSYQKGPDSDPKPWKIPFVFLKKVPTSDRKILFLVIIVSPRVYLHYDLHG